jgi:type I restriction enzyme S subunit
MEECNLPVGWGRAILSDLIAPDGEFSDGDWVESKDQDPNGNIRLLQLADIGDAKFLDKSARFVNEVKFTELRCTEVLENDVLIARMPDPLGRACQVPSLQQKAITVVDIAIVRPGINSVDPRWLMHAINSPVMRETIAIQSTGTTRRRIARGKLADLQFPLPPCNEQKRIAAKLDTTLAAVDACRQRLDGVAAILKRFRQAVLAAATSGELTREWREKTGARAWTVEKATDACAKVQSGGTPKEGFIDEPGVPFLKVYNLVNQEVNFRYKPQFVRPQVHLGPLAKSRVMPGDVLMNIVGPPLGKVAIAPDDFGEWNINQAITLFRPSDKIRSRWIYCLLCEGTAIREIELRTKGSAGQVNISLTQCRDFDFPVPSIKEQDEIIERVEFFFSLAHELEAKLTAARKVVDRLTPALLAKAFRGELVPQDPGDEPASVLLERIRAARQAEAGAGKPSRRGRRKAAAHPDQLLLDAAPIRPDLLRGLLRECGALSELALLAASELDPGKFRQQLAQDIAHGVVRETDEDGHVLLELVS